MERSWSKRVFCAGAVLVCVALVAAGCGGSTAHTQATTTTRHDPQACRDWGVSLIPVLQLTAEGLEDFEAAAFGIGITTFAEAAERLLLAAGKFTRALEMLDALGSPPPRLAEVARLLREALDLYAEGSLLGSRGARANDTNLLDESMALIEEGGVYSNQSHVLLTPTLCDS